MKAVLEILGSEFERELRSAVVPVLVFFYTSRSGPGPILGPSLARLARELGEELKVARVNLDHNPELAEHHHILAAPTLILFHCGVPIERFEGLPSWPELKARLCGSLADYANPRAP